MPDVRHRAVLAALVLAAAAASCSEPVGTSAALDERAAQSAQVEERRLQLAADAEVRAAVNAKLATDRSLSRFDIEVDAHLGQVVLTGSAPDASARKRAGRLAAAALGVVAVDNRLVLQ